MLNRFLLCLFLLSGVCLGQGLPVIMLSDLHFDPLRDPAKAARLASAPESGWAAILQEPATPGQAENFAAVQEKCGSRRGLDSDYALLSTSLHAAASQTHKPLFVTVSGDLLVHRFECRWKVATGDTQGYAEFAEKTSRFVIGQVEAAFANTPVYVALGNNDSSCGDYRMDLHDRYLQATGPAVIRGLVGATRGERDAALATYKEGGYYSVRLPGLKATRLLVVDDIYLSRKYTSCGEKRDSAPGKSVIAWLDAQLKDAQRRGEAVWLLAHIPPGVDVYSTESKPRDVCGGAAPEMFLDADTLGATLAKYPETVQLAIFGHTHNDEVRLLGEVPAKLVGSVTPVNGNLPSFTVGRVDAGTAMLRDYAVYVAADLNGAAPWSREYDFRETFGADGFTGAALRREIAGFRSDPQAEQPASQAYERNFFPGSASPLGLIWPQAVCALGNTTAEAYRGCTCAK